MINPNYNSYKCHQICSKRVSVQHLISNGFLVLLRFAITLNTLSMYHICTPRLFYYSRNCITNGFCSRFYCDNNRLITIHFTNSLWNWWTCYHVFGWEMVNAVKTTRDHVLIVSIWWLDTNLVTCYVKHIDPIENLR